MVWPDGSVLAWCAPIQYCCSLHSLTVKAPFRQAKHAKAHSLHRRVDDNYGVGGEREPCSQGA
jgi:hypothetical protein